MKKKVYVLNHGTFNLFGYNNIHIPAIIDLEEDQIEWMKSSGYRIEEVTENQSAVSEDSVQTIRNVRTISLNELQMRNKLNGGGIVQGDAIVIKRCHQVQSQVVPEVKEQQVKKSSDKKEDSTSTTEN